MHHDSKREYTVLILLLFMVSLLGISLLTDPRFMGMVLVSPNETGIDGQTREQNYDMLLDAMFADERVVTSVNERLWVPWFSSSTSCTVDDLHKGPSCDAGEISFTNNCMVTDEFSQVGILVAMGSDQQRMDNFYNTVMDIQSDFGSLPAWRIYRNGTTIEQCREGINGNCDTASDASARIIIALYTASNNSAFSEEKRRNYAALAKEMADDMIAFEMEKTCRPGLDGDICYWLAAGSQARIGGLNTTDFAYTGYFADATIAMLQTCAQTKDEQYCDIAKDIADNYLLAAKYDGETFTVPPGRSFRWEGEVPVAKCTHTCSPAMWDDADAPRAYGMCLALYYAQQIDYAMPKLDSYCDVWGQTYLGDTDSAPLQYYADGAPEGYDSGFFIQALQSFVYAVFNPSSFGEVLDNALDHFSTSTSTWDYTSCFGVYHQAFPIRSLGVGIGRDSASFPSLTIMDQHDTAPLNETYNRENTTNATDTNTTDTNTTDTNTTDTNTTDTNTTDTNTTDTNTTDTNTTNVTKDMEPISFSYVPLASITLEPNEEYELRFELSNPDHVPVSSVWKTPKDTMFNQTFITVDEAGVISLLITSPVNNLSHTMKITIEESPSESPSKGSSGGSFGGIVGPKKTKEDVIKKKDPKELVAWYYEEGMDEKELITLLKKWIKD